ncbi:MAG: formylglycine-generating enzyme family protein [Cyanobacteria bacterium P01_H01_bin.58]
MTTDPTQRLQLFNLLANLPPAQFNSLLFALKAPIGNVSGDSAPPADRVWDFLAWTESPLGCGLDKVMSLLEEILGNREPNFVQPSSEASSYDELTNSIDEPPPLKEWKEHLGNGVDLEMVNIPGGRFWMGSPDSEEWREKHEGPVHSVTVPAFAMGKYPVTQVEWSEVAALPKIKIALEPFPSHFKGDRRPVEQVNWYEAVEFCERLSQLTQRGYRLPSEAEWEYACRARTQTPFHFGETISTEQANYDGNEAYGAGQKGEYRESTIDVGSFPANQFGLYDMHGNVWEWCQDCWHNTYQGAPVEGAAWTKGGSSDLRVRRGGSWSYFPRYCRSAFRVHGSLDDRISTFGFRVVSVVPRAL